MFKKWLKENYNMSRSDYKKLDQEQKLDYYKEYAASVGEVHKCPHCGTDMVSSTEVWYGANSTNTYDLCLAIVANPAHKFITTKARALMPTAHVCPNCGFMGLYLSKHECTVFTDTCIDLKYHSD